MSKQRYLKLLSSQINNSIIQIHYTNYTKILKKAVKILKQIQNIRKFKNSNNKTKTMWNIINSATNKKQPKNQRNISLKINNVLIDNAKEIANTLNSFSSNIGNNKLELKILEIISYQTGKNTFFF